MWSLVHPIYLWVALPAKVLPMHQQSAAVSGYCGKTKELAHTPECPSVDTSKMGGDAGNDHSKSVSRGKMCLLYIVSSVLNLRQLFFKWRDWYPASSSLPFSEYQTFSMKKTSNPFG